MRNQGSLIKTQYDDQNFTIKFVLICVLILICIGIGENSFHKIPLQNQVDKKIKSKILELDQNKAGVLTNCVNENSAENIQHLRTSKILKKNTGISLYSNIEIPKLILIGQYDKQQNKKNKKVDIESFMESNTNLAKEVIATEIYSNNDLETPTINLISGETNIQGMTISQQGNFNVALQVNIRGVGQIQHMEQIGNNNNNTTKYRNNKWISFGENVLGIIRKQPFFMTVQNGTSNETMDLPISQFSDQLYGKEVAEVYGNENITNQFQEATDKQLAGRNEAYISIKGNTNEVWQYQSGFHNTSRVNVSGNENLVVCFQKGDLNYTEVNISSGSNNVTKIAQSGFYNSSSVYQAGENNKVTIIQHQ